MTTEKKPCPLCKRDSLVQHCKREKGCGWYVCLTSGCTAMLDFKRKLGHVNDGTGLRRRVKFLPGGEVA